MAKYRTLRPNIQPGPSAPSPAPAAPSYPRRPPGRPTPWRPRRPPFPALPKPPTKPPGGPLFTPWKRPKIPFGKRLPPGIGRLPPSVLKRLFPYVVKGLPWFSAAITAWEIYDWYRQSAKPIDETMLLDNGFTLCCSQTNGQPIDKHNKSTSNIGCTGSVKCGLGGQIPSGSWPLNSPIPANIKFLAVGNGTLGGARMSYQKIYTRPAGGVVINPIPARPMPFIPWIDPRPLPMPDWLAPPVPFAPQPLPLAPPLTLPDPMPSPEAPPVPPPAPRPPIMPAPRPGVVPAINWSPGGFLDPGDHVKRPPDPPTERERKKRLGPSDSWKWYKFIERVGGSYMEFDDNVAAIYKGLHWSVRRWRGRDGVWRDRDITSTARLERIFQYAESVKFNVHDAIVALQSEQSSDRTFGKIGKILSDKTRDNANAGWWAGLRGPGQTPQDNQWSEAYKELQRQRYQRNKKLRKYTSWREAQNGQWVRVERRRPDTQIPWFKQDSLYPAPLRLRGNQLNGGFARRYYAPSATQRPRTIKGLR